MSEEKVYVTYVTEEGLKKLQDEYDHLIHVEREENLKELKEARALGDLSENADYDAARERQAQIQARINELEAMLDHYELNDTSKGGSKTVRIGSTVTIEFLDIHQEETYTIVGSTEADPLNGKLSNETPLAQAILDHKIGDTVSVQAKTPYDVIIITIK